ncbi:MAG: AEC family transporter [Pseudomonadota bacterium]
MLAILDILAPIFLLIALGWLATRLGWIRQNHLDGLSQVLFTFAIPVMLFRTIASTEFPSPFPWQAVVSFYLGGLITFICAALIARLVFGRDYVGMVMFAIASIYSNTVLLGLPIILTGLGEQALLPYFVLLSLHGMIYLTASIMLLESGPDERKDDSNGHKGFAARLTRTLHGIITSPLLIGVFAGLIWQLAFDRLPTVLDRMGEMMTQALIPFALFTLGGLLRRYSIAGSLTQTLTVCALKLVILPLVIYGIGKSLFTIPDLWLMVAVLLAAQPVGINTMIIAMRYETGQRLAASTIFLSTLMSVPTLSILLHILSA